MLNISDGHATLDAGGRLSFLVDPYSTGLSGFFIVLAIKTIFQFGNDFLFGIIMRSLSIEKLPSRSPPIMKGLETLSRLDKTYMVLNQGLEVLYMSHFFYVCQHSADFNRDFVALSSPFEVLMNVVAPFYLMFIFDDLNYYTMHWILHLPAFYPYLHKHHHRQALPTRGYLDAINEHPVEQLAGILCLVFGVWYNIRLWELLGLQIHVVGFAAFVAVYGVTGLANHSAYDMKLPWLFNYAAANHEMHHRFPRYNLAQNTMMFDHLFGTFRAYRSGQKTE